MTVVLYEPSLGSLQLDDCTNGYDVESVEVGGPDVREVTSSRPLSDGVFDRTRFLAARAVTLNMNLIETSPETRLTLLDRIAPYLHPGRRCELTLGLDPTRPPRMLRVRGGEWSVPWESPEFIKVSFSFKTYGGPYFLGTADKSIALGIGGGTQNGRRYDEYEIGNVPQVGPNLLASDDAASFESTLGEWAATTGTVVRSTEGSDVGKASAKITSTGAGTYLSFSAATRPTVTPGTYTLLASAYTSVAGRGVALGFATYKADGSVVSNADWGYSFPLTRKRWNRVARIITVPAGAERLSFYVAPQNMATTGGEVMYVDRLGIYGGTQPTAAWRLPSGGFLPARTEWGRQYDRTYPHEGGATVADAHNDGNAPAEWRAKLTGPVTGFALTNTRTSESIVLPTLNVPAGEFLIIDSATHSVLANGDPGSSRYSALDFDDTTWFTLLPGANRLSTFSNTFGVGAVTTIEWRDAYM